ncbi:MAG TPA: DUF2604 domain-containing protein [Ohtaekwangia sp.]|nr:DUF2604 domain-containing protein [Ohtaekwangia sp.]
MDSSKNAEKKITLHIMIEGGRTFTEEFVVKQKLQVVVNKTLENFSLTDVEKRNLTRADGSQLSDFKLTIEDLGLRDGETLRFLLKAAPKPDEPKKFA